jgi:beta-lysine 5,6-aminomutase alpha subunit
VGRAAPRRGRGPRPLAQKAGGRLGAASGCPRAATPSRAGRARKQVGAGVKRIDVRRRERERMIAKHGDAPRTPWIYLIVATGDIYEDIPQAQQAAARGRRRDRGDPLDRQSLLDYVPEGATARASPAPTPPRRTSA